MGNNAQLWRQLDRPLGKFFSCLLKRPTGPQYTQYHTSISHIRHHTSVCIWMKKALRIEAVSYNKTKFIKVCARGASKRAEAPPVAVVVMTVVGRLIDCTVRQTHWVQYFGYCNIVEPRPCQPSAVVVIIRLWWCWARVCRSKPVNRFILCLL